jgi:hypothetical protein
MNSLSARSGLVVRREAIEHPIEVKVADGRQGRAE